MRRAIPLLLFASLLACGNPVQPVPAEVERFTAQQLPDAQQPVVIFRDPTADLLVFRVSYGSGLDCPSGCFYRVAYGLRLGERIGWMGMLYGHPDEQPAGLTFFDVTPADAVLFGEATFGRFESLPPESLDAFAYRDAFLPMLARDRDTPPAALLRVARSLRWFRNPAVGRLLLDRADVRRNRAVLQVLADLPGIDGDPWYQEIRDRARQLLAELDD